MFNDEIMDIVLKKCKENPEYLKVFEKFMQWSQCAPTVDMSVAEMAAICTMGFAIGQDPSLQEMIMNMMKISKLGLDIKDE